MSDPVVDSLLRAVEALTAAVMTLTAERRVSPSELDPLSAPGARNHTAALCTLCGREGHTASSCPLRDVRAAELPVMPPHRTNRPREAEPVGGRRELFEKLYNDGATFPVIAQTLGVSETVAWRWVDKLGLPRRGAHIRAKEVDEVAFKERWAAGDSYEELGAAFNVSKSKVWDLKKKLELPDRPQNKGFGKAGQPERRATPRVDIEVNIPTEPVARCQTVDGGYARPARPEPRKSAPIPLVKLFPLKPAPIKGKDYSGLQLATQPVRRFELPILPPTVRKPLAKIDTESNEVVVDTVFDEGLQRRCTCNRVFTAHSLKEVACPSCRIV